MPSCNRILARRHHSNLTGIAEKTSSTTVCIDAEIQSTWWKNGAGDGLLQGCLVNRVCWCVGVMAFSGPEMQWKWLELHDLVSLRAVEKKIAGTATRPKQWRLHSRPRAQHSRLDEHKLHYAAWDGRVEHVKGLVDCGVPVDCIDPRGWTAIHLAAFKGHLALLQFLLHASEMDVNYPDFFGCTPLHRSCMGGNKDTAEYLLQNGASHEARSCCGQTPLHLAAASGHLSTARTLLQHLASPDVLDSRRWTPLHWAVFGGWGDVAELLLDNGAELEGPNGVGTSPLQLAVMIGNEAAVRLLLHRGADTNLKGPNGRTALHLCACTDERKILQHLLAAGAEVSLRDRDQAAPLHLAALSGSGAVLHLLILNGARLEDRDSLHMTPLHYSTLKDNAEAAKLLLHYGADVNTTEWLGKTPLHLATERGHCKVLSVLLKRGADPAIRTKWKETAEDLARTNKQYGSLKMLQEHRKPPVRQETLVYTITESVW